MSEEEIDGLMAHLKAGTALGWMDSSSHIHRISAISSHPDEPSRVAWLKDGKPGQYVALYNCPISDFYLLIPA